MVLDTATGRTGRYLAAFRGRCQVLAVCYTRHAQRILALSYSVGGSFDSKYGASYLEISSAERFRERDAVCDGC